MRCGGGENIANVAYAVAGFMDIDITHFLLTTELKYTRLGWEIVYLCNRMLPLTKRREVLREKQLAFVSRDYGCKFVSDIIQILDTRSVL